MQENPVLYANKLTTSSSTDLVSSPGRSLGKAIVLSPASALALALAAASALAKC